jgi:hypothetical protein
MGDPYYPLTVQIVEKHRLNLDDRYTTCLNDADSLECKEVTLSLGRNNHKYQKHPPGLSFLGVLVYMFPFYFGFGREIKYGSLIFLNTILAVLLIYYIYKFSKKYTNKKNALEISVIFAFGTIIYLQSQTFNATILVGILVLASYYYFFSSLKNIQNWKYPIISGILVGYLYPTKPLLTVLAIPVLLYYLIYLRRNVLFFIIGFTPTFFIGLLYFNYCFGSPIISGYSTRINNFLPLEIIDETRLFIKDYNIFLVPSIFLGTFFYSPFLLYSFYGIIKNFHKLEIKIVSILFLISLVIWSSSFTAYATTYRLNLYSISLLSIPLAMEYRNIRNKIWFKALVVLSFIIVTMNTLNYGFHRVYQDFLVQFLF